MPHWPRLEDLWRVSWDGIQQEKPTQTFLFSLILPRYTIVCRYIYTCASLKVELIRVSRTGWLVAVCFYCVAVDSTDVSFFFVLWLLMAICRIEFLIFYETCTIENCGCERFARVFSVKLASANSKIIFVFALRDTNLSTYSGERRFVVALNRINCYRGLLRCIISSLVLVIIL